MNLKRITALTLIAMLVCGCAAKVEGPPYEKMLVPPEKSVVYLYKPIEGSHAVVAIPFQFLFQFLFQLLTGPAAASPPTVNCGDYSIALGAGHYHRFVVEPGQIRCSVVTEGMSSAVVDAKPGKEYYVKESIQSGITQGRAILETVDPDVFRIEIIGCTEQ